MNAKNILIFLPILLCYTITVAQSWKLDPSFDQGTGADSNIISTTIQNDGKIIIGGRFSTYNGTIRNRIARLNVDGSLDTSFDPGTGASSSNSSIWTAPIQSDGKIIIAGEFDSINGKARKGIARLNTDGSLDATFNPGTGVNYIVMTSTIQSDGKIIIGGHITSYNGTTINGIARLNTDGSLDLTFNPGTGANRFVRTIAIQNDGKIIIGGLFSSYNGTARNGIARLNTDGSLDTTFDPGSGASSYEIPWWTVVSNTSIQSDGKIIISGVFDSINGTERNGIARLNIDGSLDNSFNPGTGASKTSIQSDGKIIIEISTTHNGTTSYKIGRLNIDGSLDTTFDTGTGTNNSVISTSIQSDGKIIIGGIFTSFNGIAKGRIVRIYDCPVTHSLQTKTACKSYEWNGNIYTTSGTYKVIIPNAAGCDSIMTLNLSFPDVSVTQNWATLTSNATSATYQWVDCDNAYAIIPGETNKNYIPTVNGNYAVVVTQNNCTDTSSCFSINNASLQSRVKYHTFQISPNPFSTETTLKSSQPIINGTLTVYNSLGDVVSQIININGESVSISRANLATGLYFVRLTEGEHELMMKKVVVVD
jgi:uncharacterized delta-60 repeat protein